MAGGALTGRFPALKHRNFRRYALGQVISLAGFWMQSVAQGWLVYRLSGSELALGGVAFVGYLPIFLFSPVAGVVADRIDKRTLILITQTLMMLLAAAQGLVVVTDLVTVPMVIPHCDVRMFGWVRSSSRDILKNIHRNSKGLMNYYNS